MGNRRETSQAVRDKIIEEHKKGIGYRKISAKFNIPVSTIGNLIIKWKTHGTTINRPRTGAPRKISTRAFRMIARKVTKDRNTTRGELQKELEGSGIVVTKPTISNALRREGFKSRTARKTPLLKKKHLRDRLKFANDHLHEPDGYWDKIIWSDETKIELFGKNTTRRVWRKDGTAYDPKNTIPTVKFGGGSIMVWGCFTSKGPGALHIIEGKMDATKYVEILNNCLLSSVKALGMGRKWIFQQDNDPKHTAKMTSKWFEEKKINVLQWPSQSPDLNPIENLWRELKIAVHKRDPRNIQDLKKVCVEEWAKIKPDHCKKLIATYKRRLEAVIANNGYATKY